MAKYHLHLAHLYGDLLNTYSDVGNIIALQYYAKQMDADIDVKVISIDNDFNPQDFDLALFGGGQDYEQLVVSKDLPNKKRGLTNLLTMANRFLLFVEDTSFLVTTILVLMARRFRDLESLITIP